MNSLKKILRIINRSQVGKELLQLANKKAYQQGETLFDIIKVGEISVSDTTLLRKFYPQNPEQIIYETKSKIFLNFPYQFTFSSVTIGLAIFEFSSLNCHL